MTAAEIRETILRTVSANGGHLASSLGAVELSMALAEVFDPKTDRIVVLSAYTKKMLAKYGKLHVETMEELAASCL